MNESYCVQLGIDWRRFIDKLPTIVQKQRALNLFHRHHVKTCFIMLKLHFHLF